MRRNTTMARRPPYPQRSERPTTLLRSGLALPDYLKVQGNSFLIDIGKLPLPHESYVANAGWTERAGTTVSMFVANRDRNDATKLKTRVELRFPQEAFLNFWKNSQEFHQGLKKLTERLPYILDGVPGENPAQLKSEKDHVASASIAVMTHGGTQAEIDVFDLPATDIFLSQRHKDPRRLEINPILRVYTTTSVLWNILQGAEAIASEIEPQVNRLLELVPTEKEQ
jgi:hypothetical protein